MSIVEDICLSNHGLLHAMVYIRNLDVIGHVVVSVVFTGRVEQAPVIREGIT